MENEDVGSVRVKGPPLDFDPSNSPKGFLQAMVMKDRQEWAGADYSEYLGFIQNGIFRV